VSRAAYRWRDAAAQYNHPHYPEFPFSSDSKPAFRIGGFTDEERATLRSWALHHDMAQKLKIVRRRAPRAASFTSMVSAHGAGVIVAISSASNLESRVYRFAFQREDAKDALMGSAQRLTSYKALQRFNAKRELPAGK